MEQTALNYLKGLFVVEKEKTMSAMEKSLEDVCKQSLGHFISNSPWEAELKQTKMEQGFLPPLKGWVSTLSIRWTYLNGS